MSDALKVVGIAGCVLFIPAGCLTHCAAVKLSVDTATVYVKDKEAVADSGGSEYLIYTDSGVFVNKDSLWHWKWDSSDFYNEIEVGKTYRITKYGWRVPFLSMYENIIDYESVAD